MQFKYVSAFLLAGACLAQVSLAQSNTDIQQRGIVEYLINKSKAEIETLTDLMTYTMNNALKIFDELRDTEISIARKAVASVEQLLNNVTSDAQNQIQEIADRALELGIDISACIAASEEQLNQLLRDFLDDEVQCVQKEIDRAFEIIDESTVNITKTFNESQVLHEKLSDCGSELSSIECITGIFWEAKILAMQLPLDIGRQVAETTNYVVELNIRLEVCATTQVAGAEIEAAKIVTEVGQCAAETIGDNIKN